MKFGNGDAYNKFQWPSELIAYREGQRKPALTVNKTQVHCLQIINDQRQNKTSISIRPVGGEATAGDPADARADRLHRDHHRQGDHHGPQQAKARPRTSLGIGRDAARIVVGRSGDNAGPQPAERRSRVGRHQRDGRAPPNSPM